MSDLNEYEISVNGHNLTVQLTDTDARAAGLIEPAEEIDIDTLVEARLAERAEELESEFEERVAAEVARLTAAASGDTDEAATPPVQPQEPKKAKK